MRHKDELRPYQDRVASHLYEHDEALAVMRPGFGKTIAALTAIEELQRYGIIRHALVIAPKRVARVVWPDEISSWSHTSRLRYQVLDGPPTARLRYLHRADECDVTIVGLDVAQWLCEALVEIPDDHPVFDLLVIDEASRLRNPTGQRAKALAKIAGRWKMLWGLSGTLRPSGPLDLFMPARVVTRGKLWGRSFYSWRQQHFYPTDYMGYDWVAKPGAEDLLNAQLAPLVTTVTDAEMVQVEPTIVIDRVELSPGVRYIYRSMEDRLMSKIASDRTVVAASSAVATGKLAQVANGFMYDAGVTTRLHGAKREWLEEIVENATGPTLLIYEYKEDLQMIRDVIDDAVPYLGDGVGDAQSSKNIAAWNAGLLPFLALHPASGGHGLNLQHGGSDMAWISPTWSPEYWEQTIARLNRSGQKRQVVVRVCVATNTVDAMKLDRVHQKMTAQEAFEAYLRRWQTHNRTA